MYIRTLPYAMSYICIYHTTYVYTIVEVEEVYGILLIISYKMRCSYICSILEGTSRTHTLCSTTTYVDFPNHVCRDRSDSLSTLH